MGGLLLGSLRTLCYLYMLIKFGPTNHVFTVIQEKDKEKKGNEQLLKIFSRVHHFIELTYKLKHDKT